MTTHDEGESLMSKLQEYDTPDLINFLAHYTELAEAGDAKAARVRDSVEGELAKRIGDTEDYYHAELIETLVIYRERLTALSNKHKAELEKPKEMLAKLEGELLRRLNDEKMTSFPSDFGKVTKVTLQKYSITDPVAFQKFVLSQKDTSYFTSSVAKPAIQAYIEKNGAPPPGIGTFAENSLRFNKPKG